MGKIESIRLAGLAAFDRGPATGAMSGHAPDLIDVRVSRPSALLVDEMQAPIRQALDKRNRVYLVEIDGIGCIGEILVTISSSRGRLPLLFGREDLEPGYVHRIVSDTVERFGL
jgi:hypothetical protein